MRKAGSFRSRRKRSFSTKGGKCAGDVEKRNDAYCDEKRCGLWFSCARNPRAMSGYAREENHFTSLAKVLTLPQRRILVEKIADRRGFGFRPSSSFFSFLSLSPSLLPSLLFSLPCLSPFLLKPNSWRGPLCSSCENSPRKRRIAFEEERTSICYL